MKSSIEVIIFLYIHFFSSITPEQWASSTDNNIEKAEAECKASASLRGVIDSILDQCARDIESQRAKVNLAFEKRTQEIADAKQTLEQHLEKVNFYANGRFCVVAYSWHTKPSWLGAISTHTSGIQRYQRYLPHTMARRGSLP